MSWLKKIDGYLSLHGGNIEDASTYVVEVLTRWLQTWEKVNCDIKRFFITLKRKKENFKVDFEKMGKRWINYKKIKI